MCSPVGIIRRENNLDETMISRILPLTQFLTLRVRKVLYINICGSGQI